MPRSVIGALLAGVLALSAIVLPAMATTSNIVLDPTQGQVGTTVTVAGTGFTARERGEVIFDTTHVARFRSDRSGAFTIRFTVPSYPDGTYDLTATAATASATARFTVGSGTVTPPPSDDPGTEPVAGNPLTNATLFVDPNSHARREAEEARAAGLDAEAEVWDRIGDHSQAEWFGDWYDTGSVRSVAGARAREIRAVGALPVFVVYAIPQRDCGGYSAGGTNNPDAYRAWISEFAEGIAGPNGEPSVVILEPDALAQLDCLKKPRDRETRLRLIEEAVGTLNAAGASVYLDAGNSAWIPASTMADRLIAAGIADARGFATNVSNYRWTSDEIAFGTDVSNRVGGKPFVIDTSRNGLGPSTDPSDPEQWCNPPGRALGARPTADAGNALVDGYLWIKRPGESDGTCKGGPSAGSWWPEYAYGLAERAPWAP